MRPILGPRDGMIGNLLNGVCHSIDESYRSSGTALLVVFPRGVILASSQPVKNHDRTHHDRLRFAFNFGPRDSGGWVCFNLGEAAIEFGNEFLFAQIILRRG